MKHLYYLTGLFLLFTALSAPVTALDRSHWEYDEANNTGIMIEPNEGFWKKAGRLIQEEPLDFIATIILGAFCGGGLTYSRTQDWRYIALSAILGSIVLSMMYLILLVSMAPQREVVIVEAKGGGGIPPGYLATILDLIVLLLLLLFGYRGFRNGLVLQFLSTGATLLSLVFSKSIFYTMQNVSKSLWPGLDEAALPFAAIVLSLVIGLCFFYILDKLLKLLLEQTFLGYFDSLLGGLLGIVQAGFCISAFILFLRLNNIALPESYTENMRVYQSVAMLVPKCVAIFKAYLPQQAALMVPDGMGM